MVTLIEDSMGVAKRMWFKGIMNSLLSLGYSRKQIAEELGISDQRMINILNGTDAVSDKIINKIVNRYNLGQIHLVTESTVQIHPGDEQEVKETVLERLERYLLLCGISEEQAVVNARLDNDWFNSVRREERVPTDSDVKSFLKAFPDLNEEWLLKGIGDMRNSNALPISNKHEPMARILQLLKEEDITLEEFAKVVNSTSFAFRNAYKWPIESRSLIIGNDKAIKSWVDAFCAVFPKYSKFWILTGKTSKYNYPTRKDSDS